MNSNSVNRVAAAGLAAGVSLTAPQNSSGLARMMSVVVAQQAALQAPPLR